MEKQERKFCSDTKPNRLSNTGKSNCDTSVSTQYMHSVLFGRFVLHGYSFILMIQTIYRRPSKRTKTTRRPRFTTTIFRPTCYGRFGNRNMRGNKSYTKLLNQPLVTTASWNRKLLSQNGSRIINRPVSSH